LSRHGHRIWLRRTDGSLRASNNLRRSVHAEDLNQPGCLIEQIAVPIVLAGLEQDHLDGTVNLSSRVSRMQATGSGALSSLQTHATDFGPNLEFLGPGSSMLGGSDVIAAKVEEVIDLIVG
jgi:hypothetical protein